jgi:hypothetical protein
LYLQFSSPVAASMEIRMFLAEHISRSLPILRGVVSGAYFPSASALGMSPVWKTKARSRSCTLSGLIWSSGE